MTCAINVPTLALLFLHARNQARFSFARKDSRLFDGISAVEVAFDEAAQPTLVRDSYGGNVPAKGRAWIDPTRGTVLRIEADYDLTTERDRTQGRRQTAHVSTSFERQPALDAHVPRDRVHYLPNAVDLGRFHVPVASERASIRAEAHWPADALICLYVGRLSEEKGVLDVLAAWREVRHPDALLVLVGPDMTGHALDAGPLARRYVSEHGMGDRVRFHGASNDVARLLRGADIYVQPSHYEAFSNAVIEAMATGLPVVTANQATFQACLRALDAA